MRDHPGTIFLWWWIPGILSAGLLNGGSTVAAFVVIGLAFAFACWFYR